MTTYMTLAAYLSILLLVGASLYAWVRLLWRDLEALRLHADRIGAGDLQARAQVSPRSQIRVIVDHSNRMAARVAELVQRQRDLTHAISHELRTPIARVAFGLDLMQDSDDRERRARLAEGLHGDLAELNRLVSELLAYERLEHPSEGEPMQRIEANDWLQACLADARRDAERAGLVLRVQPSALPRVDAEPRLLQLALSNLVGNALRHARSQVEVSLVGVGGRACLRVDDDGPGIAEADREKVVRPFTRLDDSRSRDTGGFGLGLAIVGRIAARHHGELRIGRATLAAHAWKCTGRWLPAERPRARLQLVTTPAQLRTDRSPAYRHAGNPAARAGCACCFPPIVESFHVPASPFPCPALPGPAAGVRRPDRLRQDDHWTFELAGGGVAATAAVRSIVQRPRCRSMPPRRGLVSGHQWHRLGHLPRRAHPRAGLCGVPVVSARTRTRCLAVPTSCAAWVISMPVPWSASRRVIRWAKPC